jgi:hypothetical protein
MHTTIMKAASGSLSTEGTGGGSSAGADDSSSKAASQSLGLSRTVVSGSQCRRCSTKLLLAHRCRPSFFLTAYLGCSAAVDFAAMKKELTSLRKDLLSVPHPHFAID